MSITISRRTFMKSAAIASGAVAGAGALLPESMSRLAGASGTGFCRLGGNGPFLTTEEPKLGQTVSVHRVYKAWDEQIFSPEVAASYDKGRGVIISVWPANHDRTHIRRWADIARGDYDAELSGIAAQFKAFAKTHPRKVGLCFHHEPENDRDESLGTYHLGSEADFRAAWLHFFSYLSSHGVRNILRALILFGSSYTSGKANNYWPGDSWVDRVGADCYNWYGTDDHPTADWQSFQQIVQGTNDYAVAKNRFAWICETATNEDPSVPGRKAQWITDMGSTLKTMPKIRAVLWYEGGTQGWWLSTPPEGSSGALSAYKGLLSQDYFI